MKLDVYQLASGVVAASAAYVTAGRFGWNRTAAAVVVLSRTFFSTFGVALISPGVENFFPAKTNWKQNRCFIALAQGALMVLNGKVGEVVTRRLGVPLSFAESIALSSLYITTISNPIYWLITPQ